MPPDLRSRGHKNCKVIDPEGSLFSLLWYNKMSSSQVHVNNQEMSYFTSTYMYLPPLPSPSPFPLPHGIFGVYQTESEMVLRD